LSNPLDTNEFKHYLKFISLGREDLYQISEPIGFDGATFNVEQVSKKSARDVRYGALDKLEFIDAVTDRIETPQIINPQGDTSNYLDYGLQWLLSIYKDYGFEAKVEYILQKDGLTFSNGMLDFTDKDITDGYTYVSCKLIQNNNVQNVKRRFDDKFNAFSDKDVNENTITPITTFKYLRKATPIKQFSKFELPSAITSNAGTLENVNFAQQITESEIDNTLTFFDAYKSTFSLACRDFKIIKAKNNLSGIKIKLENDIDINYKVTGGTSSSRVAMELWYCIYAEPFNFSDAEKVLVYTKDATGTSNYITSVANTIEFEIPSIPADYTLTLFWARSWGTEHLDEGNRTSFVFRKQNVIIEATSTAIDQVINVVNWIDLIKQGSKFNQNIPINAPLFDVGGIHYKNVCFNKRMMTQRTDFLYTTPKEVFESVNEVNFEHEIKENEIFIGHSQDDFYTNDEIGVFDIIPSEDFVVYENDKAQINKFTYGYKNYEQDRTTIGTSESFNTEAEFRVLNDNVENVKEVKVNFTRDSKAIQKSLDLEISLPTTSTTDDDKIFIENSIELAPNTLGGFGRNLLMRENLGNLEILNRNSNGDTGDVAFIWTNLGLNVGQTFNITFGENIGSYQVVSLEPTIIKLQPITAVVDYSGDAFITFSFVYTGIAYTTRTNEGFTEISGIDTTFGNIAYSIKRNIGYFKKYLAQCLLYSKKNITLGYFKNNGELSTRLITETENVVENAPILYADLPNPVISAKVYNFSVYAEFSDIYNLLELYKTKRGFLRCVDSNKRVIKGYIEKLEHTWSENRLELTLEEKFETEYLILTYTDGKLYVNDVPYNLSGVSDWWRMENDYLQLFDEKSKAISYKYKYNFVILNDSKFNTKLELTEALINL